MNSLKLNLAKFKAGVNRALKQGVKKARREEREA
jgi:hypothetical protein